MADGFGARLKHAYNAFTQSESDRQSGRAARVDYGANYASRPDRVRMFIANERSIMASVYTRISIDVAAIEIKHVRLDANDRFLEEMDSGLNDCLNIEANIDQAATAFRQDIIMTMMDKGACAIVPVVTDVDPKVSSSYDIKTMRVAEIVGWYPQHVRVSLYNEDTGTREEIVLPKSIVAIVQNPLYSVMNEPNSTYQRLVRKLNMLDAVDEQMASGKLDLIIQLPYVVKNETRRAQAAERRQMIEDQLKGSKYGIAYTDGTEKITQLNRPVENNMLTQIQDLKTQFYAEIGLTADVFNGSATEQVMLNYFSRTVQPMLTAVAESLKRTFLTKTARSQRQSILYVRDPFSLVPVSALAELADKFTRNEILTANEFRGILGYRPVTNDPKADQLINSNMPQGTSGPDPIATTPQTNLGELPATVTPDAQPDTTAVPSGDDGSEQVMNDAFDQLNSQIDDILKSAGG